MAHRIVAGGQSFRPGIPAICAVLALTLAGCESGKSHSEVTPAWQAPPGLQLQTENSGPESIMDELPAGPAGDLAPDTFSPEELVAEIERERDRCKEGGEFRDDHRERYRRFRNQLQEGANAEAAALREAGRDPYEDPRVKYMHEALIRLPANPDCGRTATGYKPEFDIAVEGGVGGMNVDLPSYRFLGTEMGGVPDLRAGYRFNNPDTAKVLNAGASIGLGKTFLGRLRLHAGVTYTEIESEMDNGTFDPDGETLLIPGTGDGPFGAGFALPSAGGLNVVTGINHEFDYDYTSTFLKLSSEFWYDDDEEDDDDPGYGVMPYFGLTYTMGDLDQRFAGSVPGFARDFEYNTRVDNDAYGMTFGFQAVRPLPNLPVTVRAGAKGQVDFNDADGHDSLFFTGFGTQRTDLSNKETTFGYTLNAGITIGGKSPLQFDIDGIYGIFGNTPVVKRDGVGRSNLDMERSEYAGAMFRTRFRF